MLGTLPNDAKKKWQDWVPTLTHAYNCMTSKTTGFSPYFLIYGQQPRLPIDIEYGISLMYSDCKPYAAKLEHCLKWAYEAAQKYIDKETTRYKKYYDKNFHCAILRNGDLVLVQINKFGTDHKIADKWEQDPWEVLSQRDNSPLLTIRNVTTNEIHELHRNMLFPLRLVDPEDPQEDNTTIHIKANKLMVNLFACDCGNCTETV